MTTIIGENIVFYSAPLGPDLSSGFEELVKRVCKIVTPQGSWTGFVVADSILSTGFWRHTKEFDLFFKDGFMTSGFLIEDWGEIIEIGFDFSHHKVDPIAGALKVPPIGERLYSIGCFLGSPFTLASCKVSKVFKSDFAMTPSRISRSDPCSTGSPLFDSRGTLVGILECYVPETDSFVIRSMTCNTNGKLIG